MTLYHAINVIALAALPIYFAYKFSANLWVSSIIYIFTVNICWKTIYKLFQIRIRWNRTMSSGWRLLLHLHADRKDAAVDFLSIAVVWHYVSTIRVSLVCYRLVRSALCIAKAHGQGTHEVAADRDRMELRWVEIMKFADFLIHEKLQLIFLAETLFTRGLSLWQAKGVEFAWTYTQKALDSNIAFVETLILVCLVWSLDRHDLNKKYIVQIWALIVAMVLLRPLIMNVDPWSKLLTHCALSAGVGLPTVYIYSSMPNSNY